MTDPIRLLIVDDHMVVRAGLRDVLSSQPDFEVIAEATNGVEAVALADRLKPDVVLTDLAMPQMDGVTAIGRIKDDNQDIQILVLSTYDSDSDIFPAIEAGAIGYLLKDAPRKELYDAIRAAAAGKPLLTSAVSSRLMKRMRSPATEALSTREIEVLKLVARGDNNREIADQLYITQATVKSHLV
ncbi:MAG: response regulator transcription factor, partial [Actinobacteria bacterium]|nr:response regulator transcription factor [Actinomycetota bacterium]MCA1738652.1 response regulator transcription factor [Actinomycetota bacterium]